MSANHHKARTLTKREVEVLREIALGRCTKEGASNLRMGPKTFEWHRDGIVRKTGVAGLVNLARYAFANCLVDFRAEPARPS